MLSSNKNSKLMQQTFKAHANSILKKSMLLLTFINVFCIKTIAGSGIEDPHSATPITGQVNTATTNALILNATSTIDYTNFFQPTTQQSKTIKNVISFGLIENSNKYIAQDFTATLELKIEYGHDANNLNVIPNQQFKVDYKKADAAKYNALQYFTLDNAEYVRITVVSITAPTIGSLNTADVLVVNNEMRITRYVELPNVVPTINNLTASVPTLSGGQVNDDVTISWTWPTNTGNNATQLEWAWIENETETEYFVGGAINQNLVFSNATRIDLPLDSIHYDIPLLYDGVGKLYYRIRAVNIKEDGNRTDGPWNLGAPFSFNGHNNSLNWQSTTSYAEDGKRKTVIQYFDGSLRGRQTVTKDNQTDSIIIAETFYDGQGRAAIQILPTPGLSNIIAYQKRLNMFNGQGLDQDPAEIFDMQPAVTPNSLTPALLTTSGTSQYYSTSNPLASNGFNKNIPDAEGYPYTVTRFTPDATGRVMAQSGVGAAHKMGSKHETKYYYGGAAQEELDGLFGTEVGVFSHYSKNMVQDANGQMSVSYVDMQGRTIATALAGDTTPNLRALNINDPIHYPNQAGTSITRNLLDNSTNNVKGSSIESVNSILVPAQTNYNFSYQLSPETLQMASCPDSTPAVVCYDCLYDLEIAITDESGESDPIVRKFSNVSLNPDNNCSTGVPAFTNLTPSLPSIVTNNGISFTAPLSVGSYSIRKTLTISEASLQKYKLLYMSQALCKTEQQIIDSIYNVLLNTSNCGDTTTLTCQNCLTQLGDETDYRTNYLSSIGNPNPVTQQVENDIHNAYLAAKQNCTSLCQNVSQSNVTIRQLMLSDMMPYTGQYAIYDTTDHVGPGVNYSMYNKYNIFSNNSFANQPYYKNPWKNGVKDFYYDDAGNKDVTIHFEVTPQPNYFHLDTTSKPTFEQLFKTSWADALLPHHPEYQRLLFAESPAMQPSFNWISDFNNTDNVLTVANQNNYLSPTSNDPFFTQAPSYLTQMNNAVNTNYNGAGAGMWQIAYGDVRCKSIANDNQRAICYTNAPNTPIPFSGFTAAENEQAWQVFKGLYAEKRTSLVDSFIAVTRPLAANEEELLISQNYKLWFPRSAAQTASQNQWTWWPTTQGGGPTGVNLGGATTTTAEDRCASYINMWRNQLLQCSILANSDSALRETILSQITTRMKAVCINGTNASNIYGSSTVAPTTPASVTDRSFEDVIKNVFIQYGIIAANGIYTENYCNPFVIEWPKPYGLGPKMVSGTMAGQVDSCNCNAFAKIKIAAQAQNYNPNNLISLNTYLQAQYGETLTQGMFDGLQKCNQIYQLVCTTRDTTLYYNCNEPPPYCQGEPLPKTVKDFNRPGPPSDCESFELLIRRFIKMNGSNPENCKELFVRFFNEQCAVNYSWDEIFNLYRIR
jgi:hypothetical protein